MDILNSLNLRDSRRSFFLVSSIALTLSACGGGGGGGDPDPGVIPPIGSVVLTPDQAAFETTVFANVRANCSTCHSETSENPNLVQFAHSDVITAYSVMTNGDLVDLSSPSSSRLVDRLDDGHGCGTTCEADVITMTADISEWGRTTEPPVVVSPLPPVVEPTVVSSVEAFKQTLQPQITEMNCTGSTCHDQSDNGRVKFAVSDAKTAHDATLTLVNISAPSDSELVTYLSDRRHQCEENCDTFAASVEALIVDWQSAITEPTQGNTPPTAVNDLFTTTVNVSMTTTSVLLNDSDPDNGDILSVIDSDTTSTQGGAVENNGNNGTFTYTPANGFIGEDTFSYTISDGNGGTDSATVSITVTQPVATIARNDLILANQNIPKVMNKNELLGNDIGASGNALSIISVDNPSSKGASVVLNTNDSAVTYTPPAGFSGSDTFTYILSDGLTTAQATVEVDVNTAPIAVSDAVYTYVDFSVNTGSVTNNDRDSNGDTLTVSSFVGNSAQGGSVELNADGTSFTFTPADGVTGNDSFDYIISDGRNGTATGTVFISVGEPVLADDNRFLAFLNQSAELFSESAETAAAYYSAVDPLALRTNLEDWRNLNGYNDGFDAQTIYINDNDLGFSRVMFVRTDPITGVISSYVENYANLEAAQAAQDAQNQVGVIATVAMEYTVAPGRNFDDPDEPRYMTFYVFDGNNERDLSADLDGRGAKFIPGLCNTCHGGRPQALVNGVYPDNGDTGAGFIPWDVDTFAFADENANGVPTVVERDEETFKIFNKLVLDTNPLPAVREVVEGWYGGSEMASNSFIKDFVPVGWKSNTQLYLQAVAPACRACHIMQGSALQNDIDFASYDKFISYKARIETMVYDEGTMPLALRTWDKFWDNPLIPETMARLMDSSKYFKDEDEVLSPGRPIANAGPSFREVALGRVDLNGNSSVFTAGVDDFLWTLISSPDSEVELQNADQANAFFDAIIPGDYVVQLVVNDELGTTEPSAPSEAVIRVSGETTGKSFVRDISPIFAEICARCHVGLDNPNFVNPRTLYDNLVDFVNTDDPVNSPILVKPSGQDHGGGIVEGFESFNGKNYKTILQWILEGAPDN